MNLSIQEIRDILKIQGISKISRLTNIDRSYLSEIASGKSIPSLETLTKIGEATGFSVVFSVTSKVDLPSRDFFNLLRLMADADKYSSFCPPDNYDYDEYMANLKTMDVAVEAMNRGRKSAYINILIPRLLIRNMKVLNFDILRTFTQDKRYYGYIMSLCHEISGLPVFKKEAAKVKKFKDRSEREWLIVPEKMTMEGGLSLHLPSVSKIRHPVADAWKFVTKHNLTQIADLTKSESNNVLQSVRDALYEEDCRGYISTSSGEWEDIGYEEDLDPLHVTIEDMDMYDFMEEEREAQRENDEVEEL